MKIRVLFFRAFFRAAMVSGALAQTPAATAPVQASPAVTPAANASPPPRRPPRQRGRAVRNPAEPVHAGAGQRRRRRARPPARPRQFPACGRRQSGRNALRSRRSPCPAESRRGSRRRRRGSKPRLSADPEPTLEPNTFFATAKASERYAAIVDAGGWPTDIAALHPGAKGPRSRSCAGAWRSRGSRAGFTRAARTWDTELTAAVKRFQARMGLRETGIVAGATLKAMNVPAGMRFKELASSANRLAGVDFPFGDRYVVVKSRRPRSRRSRTAGSSIAMSRSSAIPNIPRRRSPRTSRSSTSIRPGRCRPRSSRRKSSRRCSAIRATSRAQKIRILDSSGEGDQSEDDQLEHRARRQLHAEAGFGRGQFARHDPHRHAQQARRLHARHALEAAVRRAIIGS